MDRQGTGLRPTTDRGGGGSSERRWCHVRYASFGTYRIFKRLERLVDPLLVLAMIGSLALMAGTPMPVAGSAAPVGNLSPALQIGVGAMAAGPGYDSDQCANGTTPCGW